MIQSETEPVATKQQAVVISCPCEQKESGAFFPIGMVNEGDQVFLVQFLDTERGNNSKFLIGKMENFRHEKKFTIICVTIFCWMRGMDYIFFPPLPVHNKKSCVVQQSNIVVYAFNKFFIVTL